MANFIGMNFKKWCELDTNDQRKINYITPWGDFTSEQYIDYEVLTNVRSAFIKSIELVDNEWNVVLIKNRRFLK